MTLVVSFSTSTMYVHQCEHRCPWVQAMVTVTPSQNKNGLVGNTMVKAVATLIQLLAHER